MPFTVSHVAAVLPLVRTPLPVSALVIGSMSPDLPYFVGALDLQHSETHSLSGILGPDLVLGVLLWVVWHGVLAAPALAGVLAAVRARCAGARVGLWCRLRAGPLLAVLAALVVGAATHVVWDLFTHPYSWGTGQLPALSRTYGGVAGWTWAQVVQGARHAGAAGLSRRVVEARGGRADRADRATRATRAAGPPRRVGAAPGRARLVVRAGDRGVRGGHRRRPGVPETDPGLRALPFLVLTRAGTLAGIVALAVALGWHALRRAGRTAGAGTAG